MTEPRAVPATRAVGWYREAMRLWKLAPWTFCALAFLTLAVEIGLDLVPDAGTLLAKVVAPLVACGLLYASAAADAGEHPRLSFAIAVFRADASALAAIVVAGALTFAVEWGAADVLAGINLLRPGDDMATLSTPELLGIYAIGILASLPVTFVPLVALFGGGGFRASFATSFQAFALNLPAMLLYGVLSFALLVVGLLTYGIGLLIALPLWAASSYAAWREIFPSPG